MSTFGEKPDRVGPEHLQPLLQHAFDVVPKDAVADTPLFLLATAGMRLLAPLQRATLLKQICTYARTETDFHIPDCDLHIQVLAGETEGLYGWIAVNYLLGGFDPDEHARGKSHRTYGFLDMGGASAQIAFAPNKTEAIRHPDDLKLLRMRTLDGAVAEFRVFVTSWLRFGVNEARRRYVEALLKASDESNPTELEDPCLPEGLRTTTEDDVLLSETTVAGQTPDLIGGGRFDQCLNQTYPLLEKDAVCKEEPCLLGGVHVPAIDFDVNRFVGISEYWHTTHAIFEKGHKDKAYDFNTYQQRISEFCSRDWKSIQEGIDKHTWGKVTEQTAVKVCFKASWLINILYEGIGIPRVGLETTPGSDINGTKEVLQNAKEKGFADSFQAVNKIDDTEVSWTMGKMILYASSQIPPLGDKSPVGFGSNTAGGIPSDFQFAGSVLSMPSPTITNSTASSVPHSDPISDEDWHDTLFMGESPRRIPGFLLFVVIMCLAAFLLCGRDRRKSLYRRIFRGSPSPHVRPRKRRFFSPLKVPFFRSAPSAGAYERVLEDGAASDRFELGSLVGDVYEDSEGEGADNEHSDDSAGSWTGKSSGWATPRIIGGGAGNRPGGVLGGAGDYFGTGSGGAGGVMGKGIGLGIVGRSGLVGRTESRERLVGMVGGGVGGLEAAAGRRSRKVSPVRGGRGGLGVLSED